MIIHVGQELCWRWDMGGMGQRRTHNIGLLCVMFSLFPKWLLRAASAIYAICALRRPSALACNSYVQLWRGRVDAIAPLGMRSSLVCVLSPSQNIAT